MVDATGEDLSLEALRMRSAIAARLFDVASEPVSAGRFDLLEPIGRGGMGTVWRAHDPRLDRIVAVKLLRPGRGATAARLEREAHAMARLAHPHVVTIHEVGDGPHGIFVAMELVDGPTLAQWCEQQPIGDPGRWLRVLELACQAARGLAAAHEIGLVHRDVKPSNMLIGHDGRLRIADFGLVALPGEGAADSAVGLPTAASASGSLTEDGAIVGTPAYMAPEQLDGHSDARSDQFSWCATFFEAFTGVRRHGGRTLTELRASFEGAAAAPIARARVPAPILAVLERGLAIRPEQRFADMPELLRALERAARPRRVGWIAAGITAVVVVPLAMLVAQPEPCAAPEDGVGAAWDAQRRAEVRAAIGGSALPSAPATLERVEQRLTATAERWNARHVEACELERSGDATALRQCLHQTQSSFDAITAELAAADDDVVVRAVSLTDLLDDLAECEDAEDDTAARPLVDRLHRGRIALELADLDRADALLGEVVEGADGLPRLRSDALALLAELHDTREQGTTARTHAEQALDSAEEVGDPFLLARRWIGLASVIDRHGGARELSRFMLERARKIEARGELDDSTRAQLDLHEGGALQRAQQWNEAVPFYRRAAERFAAADQSFPAAQAQLQLGECLAMAGDLGQGIDAIEAAVDTLERHLGPEHPEVAWFLLILAQTHGFALDHAAAEPILDRAVAVFEAHPRFQPSLRSGAWLTRASMRLEQARWAEALVDIDRAVALLRELGNGGRTLSEALLDRARTLRHLGRSAEGLTALDEAATLEREPGDQTVLYRSWVRAELLLDLGRDAEAAEVMGSIEPLRTALTPSSMSGLQAAEETARILTRLGRAAQAIALLDEALSHTTEATARWKQRLQAQRAATLAATQAGSDNRDRDHR